MNAPQPDDRDSTKSADDLTPEALAVLAKARRSFGISMAILLIGFMAIGFALVYRALRDAPAPTIAAEIVLPAGAEVLSSVIVDGQVNVTYTLDGVPTLGLFDSETGETMGTLTLISE